MADHQKVHPVHDPEAAASPKPTAPLVPRDSSRSDKGDPDDRHQQQTPLQRIIPYSYSKPPKRNCCKRCLCWSFCLILLIFILLAITAGIIFLIFRPKLPKYSIDGLRVSQFNLNPDNSLYATFNVNITARNPNKKIGIYYEGGSRISVLYTGTELCRGSLPKFYQGHRNTTVLDVVLTGQTNDASALFSSLEAQQRQTGTIPLNLRVKVPIRVKLGKLKLMKWKFLVKCSLLVDNVSADNAVRIRDDSCKFRFRGFD